MPGRGRLAASREATTPALRSMDSGSAANATPRNDDVSLLRGPSTRLMLMPTVGRASKKPAALGERLMDRRWLSHYPPGVAADIDPTVYSSLVAMFEES